MSNYSSNKSDPSSPRSRRDSNPFSERISSILALRQQIFEQQQALSDKLEQDWKRLESITPQYSAPSFQQTFLNNLHPDVVLGNGPNTDINNTDEEIMCEPEFEIESNSSNDDYTSLEIGSESESKYESGTDDEDSEIFAVSLDIYQKVSYDDFNFHRWLKTFDLICIKEILVFHDLQLKEMWTKDRFDQIKQHPLIKRDEHLLSQIDSMLIVFNSLKRRQKTGKGVWESDHDNNYNNTANNEPTFMSEILKQHFKEPNSNIIPYKGLNFKIHKMPPMPSKPINFEYHFN